MPKIQPVILKSGRHWVIDRGPNKAMPCCDTKEEAERLLALSEKWEKKMALTIIHGHIVKSKVVNTAVLHDNGHFANMLALRWNASTYWVPEIDCEEVIQ